MVNHKSQPALQCDTPQQRLQKYDDKEAFPYIYKLWLDEELPVNYGRELLGCDKYLDPAMKMDCTPAGWTTRAEIDFEFHHMEGDPYSWAGLGSDLAPRARANPSLS